MIPYSRDPQQVIPASSVKIIGLGGAGTNMLQHLTLDDGLDGAELLAIHTDIRTLAASPAADKIQLGTTLTKGLGTGGDPDLGQQAVLEAEAAIRTAVSGKRMVFMCTGLGGGTGSGAAPIVTRIAREEGAFVVVFATMPFAFEGKRRRDQAQTALNELAVLANALVTFDNNRMGELVLAKQGVHEAFIAADHMIGESMKAVIRLVIRPGLINVGLDELMSALRTNRSRCLFGSGLATGKDRATRALRNALTSPLLDQGALLKDAQTVLVHLCGGQNLTLFEIELLMQGLQEFVPDNAHVLFGAAVDPAMGDALSLTLISALPEDSLAMAPRDSLHATPSAPTPATNQQATTPAATKPELLEPSLLESTLLKPELPEPTLLEITPPTSADLALFADTPHAAADPPPAAAPAMVAEFIAMPAPEDPAPTLSADPAPDQLDHDEELDNHDLELAGLGAIPRKRPPGSTPWSITQGPKTLAPEPVLTTLPDLDMPKLKLGIKAASPQSELSLDSTPRGRFEGENPNVFEGEDLDLPPFLRKKK